ncbi:hypothetical protein [Streptantibioticus silvisoli]|uniref:UDP-N-acetylglucosamine 2-epimerase domain-containing protein n=1 Tax=Streptantibioticus silvisoli TaxID=2705255 RepID=A0ABT6W019_9ACTN|nr:hypothetical protein [Streptantibioticus silvisoli]MDI5964094.1 hypothetical protein [Streptantibioticus silvisoli]
MNTAEQVDELMLALDEGCGDVVRTPGGVSWLHTHHVPVRRLLARVVKRLTREVPGRRVTNDELVVASYEPSVGYVTYHLSDAGAAYLLGRSEVGVCEESDLPVHGEADQSVPPMVPVPVCAVSWSSRHAETLMPVLAELARRGIASTVLDLAIDASHAVPAPSHFAITVLQMSREMLSVDGGPPNRILGEVGGNRTVQVGQHTISVVRLAEVAMRVLRRSADPTQPSWAAAVRIEKWFDRVLSQLGSSVLLCSNDTSPPGVLAVGAAERAGAETVYVQHGAWVEGQIAWRAQHCRHIAVMGTRDVITARSWTRRADARVYVVGQPRFDVLADVDRAGQRSYLGKVLSDQTGEVPPKILVWACQPFREQRLRSQFDVVAEGVRQAGSEWGLVIAPHPAQGAGAFGPLLKAADGLPVALADPGIGARGCLAGADALVSASSTCGIEAVLLDVPVLELVLPATRTLGLADQRAAQRCPTGPEVATALRRIAEAPGSVRLPATAKRAICHEAGRSGAAVADIVSEVLSEATATPQKGPNR